MFVFYIQVRANYFLTTSVSLEFHAQLHSSDGWPFVSAVGGDIVNENYIEQYWESILACRMTQIPG